jgi:hypothetical protein
VGAYQGPFKEALQETAQRTGVTAKEALHEPARIAFQFVPNPKGRGFVSSTKPVFKGSGSGSANQTRGYTGFPTRTANPTLLVSGEPEPV